ncbi:MFS transporter [Streptomyces sp. NBC_01283]|uniref:MFS transporter n=1 Tax=Streptomyces sp. NBC_01283 TaxID=2903812 RepID=UPI00352EFD98|nr:MFS transporter [Streptomyces sp. NBC_01283]
MTTGTTRAQGNRWLILAVVAGCFLPVAADATILNVAVPSLTETLGASAHNVLWIADIYPLMMVGLVLVTGPLGDRIGHKRLMLTGLVVFGAASAACALSLSPTALIGARAALATGASLIIPATLAIIRQVFDDARERAIAIGVWSAVAAGGAAIGPVAGGLILEHFWWGAVFLINLPLAAAAIILVSVLLTNHPAQHKEPWEPLSPLLGITGVIGVVYAVKSLAHRGTPLWEAWLPGLAGLAALTWFTRRQLTSTHPMLDLSLFRARSFRVGTVAATVPVLVLVGFELQLAQDLQFVHGMSPKEAGLFLLPMPLATFAAGPLAGLLVSRHGLRVVIPVGLTVAALGYAGIAASADRPASLILTTSLILIGAGHGAVQTVASDAIMTGAPPHQAGAAASVESVSYEVGAGLGIALLGSLMAGLYTSNFTPSTTVAAQIPPTASDSIGEALAATEKLPGPAAQAVTSAARDAFTAGYRITAIVAAAVVTAVAVGTAVAMHRGRPRPPEPASEQPDQQPAVDVPRA